MSRNAKRLLIAGLILFFGGPAIGVCITVAGMISAFHTLGQNGITDPSQLAGNIGTSLVATSVGIMVALPGLVLLIVALAMILSDRQARLRQEDAARLSTTPPPSP